MLKIKKLYHLLMIPLIIGFLISCEKDGIKQLAVSQEDSVLKRIKELGFDLNDVVEYDDYYLVEGDILFNKDLNQNSCKTDKNNNLKSARADNLPVNKAYNSSSTVVFCNHLLFKSIRA